MRIHRDFLYAVTTWEWRGNVYMAAAREGEGSLLQQVSA